MESDGDNFLTYYLTNPSCLLSTCRRMQSLPVPPSIKNRFPLCEVKVEQLVRNKFLVFDDGEERHRIRFAYYKLIERKMLLKKMRTEVHFLLPGYRWTQDRLFRSHCDAHSFLF